MLKLELSDCTEPENEIIPDMPKDRRTVINFSLAVMHANSTKVIIIQSA
jgi:hypothetical protein